MVSSKNILNRNNLVTNFISTFTISCSLCAKCASDRYFHKDYLTVRLPFIVCCLLFESPRSFQSFLWSSNRDEKSRLLYWSVMVNLCLPEIWLIITTVWHLKLPLTVLCYRVVISEFLKLLHSIKKSIPV